MRKQKERLIARHPRLSARLAGEYPLQTILSSTASVAPLPSSASTIASTIPPVLYQTWETPQIGKTHYKHWQAFRARNADLAFEFFDTPALDAYMQAHYGGQPIHDIYRRARFGPLKTDIWRYCILFERGGFYVDINKALMRPIREFIRPETQAFFAYESKLSLLAVPPAIVDRLAQPHHQVVNWAFGFAAGHPILKKTLENICRYYPQFAGRVFENPKHAIIKLTGPAMLTQSLYDCLQEINDPAFDAGLVQAGIDFAGSGNANLPRSWVRYAQIPAYAQARQQIIVD